MIDIIKPTSAIARRSLTKRQIPNPGVQKLRKKADEVVGTNSEKIANALVKGAEDGNASSARLLVDLADGANWVQHSDSVAAVLSIALSQPKPEPQTVVLDIVQNQPRLKPPPARLTDGSSAAADPAEGAIDAEFEESAAGNPPADAQADGGEAVEGELMDGTAGDASVPSP